MSVASDGGAGNFLTRIGAAWDQNAAYTVTGWFKCNDTSTRYGLFSIDDTGDNGDGCATDYLGDTHIYEVALIGGTGHRAHGTVATSNGTWYFFAIRRASATSLELRLGVSPYSTTTSQGIVTDDVTGRAASGRVSILGGPMEGGVWNGSMAQVRVWTTALSDADLITEMGATTPQTNLGSLWADWRLVNAIGASNDYNGNVHDLDATSGTLTDGSDDPPNSVPVIYGRLGEVPF